MTENIQEEPTSSVQSEKHEMFYFHFTKPGSKWEHTIVG